MARVSPSRSVSAHVELMHDLSSPLYLVGIERNVTEGDDLTLSVSVEGGSIDSVKWTVCCQGLQIVNNTKFLLLEDVLSVSLTILNVASEDSGMYTVTVTNSTQAVVVMQSFEVQVQGMYIYSSNHAIHWLTNMCPLIDLVQVYCLFYINAYYGKIMIE